MKLRSPVFITAISLLTTIAIFSLAVDCRRAAAQSPSGKAKKANPVLVTFVEIGSVNCIPCKAMQPIMKAVEEEFKGQVKIVFHDVWTPKGKKDAAKYNIQVIPTQVFLDKEGKEYYRHSGFFPKDDVVWVLKKKGVR